MKRADVDHGAPRLVIEPYEDVGRPLTIRDLSIRLDGQEVRGLASLQLSLERDEANYVALTLEPDSVEVDAEVLQWLEAIAKEKQDA